jgi:hypothetical protein
MLVASRARSRGKRLSMQHRLPVLPALATIVLAAAAVPADAQNTERVSVNSAGTEGDDNSFTSSSSAAMSSDGRFIVFKSDATNLVANDTNQWTDIFVRDRLLGTTERSSVDSAGNEGNVDADWPSISADGGCVAFESLASSLVSADTNGYADSFVRDRGCSASISTYCTAKTNSLGCLPTISSVGIPSQSGPDNFYVTAGNVRNNKLGMMLWSLAPDSHPFFGGTLCLHSPIKRTAGQNSGGAPTGSDCTGTYSYHFTQAYMLQQLLGADTTVYVQFWSRDPGFAPPNNIGLTNGLSFTICQ